MCGRQGGSDELDSCAGHTLLKARTITHEQRSARETSYCRVPLHYGTTLASERIYRLVDRRQASRPQSSLVLMASFVLLSLLSVDLQSLTDLDILDLFRHSIELIGRFISTTQKDVGFEPKNPANNAHAHLHNTSVFREIMGRP